jgi:hypothetical protein
VRAHPIFWPSVLSAHSRWYSAILGLDRERGRGKEGLEGAERVGQGGQAPVRRDGPARVCPGSLAQELAVESAQVWCPPLVSLHLRAIGNDELMRAGVGSIPSSEQIRVYRVSRELSTDDSCSQPQPPRSGYRQVRYQGGIELGYRSQDVTAKVEVEFQNSSIARLLSV